MEFIDTASKRIRAIPNLYNKYATDDDEFVHYFFSLFTSV